LDAAQPDRERDQDEDRPLPLPAPPGRALLRLERPLAPLPGPLGARGGVVSGERDVRDLVDGDADAPGRALVEQLDVARSAVVDVADELRAVAARHRDVAAVVEGALDLLAEAHSVPVTIAAMVEGMARADPNVARTALGSKPQWTMQSWQRGLPLARPYRDQSVSSMSSRKVRAYPSCKR